jgi:hypothetical protein
VASSVAGARSRHRQRWRVRPASRKLSNHTRLRTSARATTSPPRWLSASPPSLTRLIRTYVWVREYGGIEYGGLPVDYAIFVIALYYCNIMQLLLHVSATGSSTHYSPWGGLTSSLAERYTRSFSWRCPNHFELQHDREILRRPASRCCPR